MYNRQLAVGAGYPVQIERGEHTSGLNLLRITFGTRAENYYVVFE